MRDIFLLIFLLAILFLSLKRPFLLILTYCYVDIVAPQKLSFFLLNKIPLSLIVFGLAVISWIIADSKKGTRIDQLQVVLLILLIYCGVSTTMADFPVEALEKWSWVWKALLWSMFLPLALRTKLRIESLALVMVLSAGTLAITGGLKTVLGGSGYGSLQLLVDDNSGLFEGSIFSTVAIAIIPLTLWLARYGTIYRKSKYVWGFAIALAFACLLIPVGTQARTGLVCAGLLVLLGLRDSKRRMTYIGAIAAIGLMALPLLPAAFSSRMGTITNFQSDESASTRVAVWGWTWEYALDHPLGGGFEVYRQNELQVSRVITRNSGGQVTREIVPYTDHGRAFHNSYFEMLGEQGFPGLFIWLYLQITCLIRMERLRRRYKECAFEDEWIRPLATALQASHLVYLLGAMFVGIAFQPFIYMLIALQIGLHTYVKRREEEARWRPITVEVGGGVSGPNAAAAEGVATLPAPTGWGKLR